MNVPVVKELKLEDARLAVVFEIHSSEDEEAIYATATRGGTCSMVKTEAVGPSGTWHLSIHGESDPL